MNKHAVNRSVDNHRRATVYRFNHRDSEVYCPSCGTSMAVAVRVDKGVSPVRGARDAIRACPRCKYEETY